MPPFSLIFVAELACKVVKIKKWECFVSLNWYKLRSNTIKALVTSSCLQMFFKIGVLKFLQYSQGNRCVAVSNTHVFMACTSPFQFFLGGGLKFLEQSLLVGSKIFILLGGSHNFEVKIKIASYQYRVYFWNN